MYMNSGIRHDQLLQQYRAASVTPEALAHAQGIVSHIESNPWLSEYGSASQALGNGIPTWFIGALHYRESALDLMTYLGNGEKIIGTGKLTELVPKGRGPFETFHAGAVDALGMLFKEPMDWRDTGNCLVAGERWNGLGYARMGVVNPYLFAGTNIYQSGKYVADGKYDPHAIDHQLGIACLMKVIGIV